MEENVEKIELVLTRQELKLIYESLKGTLVRQNGMNFDFLCKVSSLGKYIEECLKD